ncbi:hypothetical protein CAPTEDRAFT_207202 [Capitella teleta]|uniref:Uncharacterized protein n=1 Tax=Capitella teleta TaxID=283909 RepID=R7T7E2_CAPTE|nr:hypothetical protein CAPTEDRAFT_207202 [Capitella teleta]|eukprot:ELT89328.1 hypothetical protein CAPTEDRAFT_207202 [Capitella teleta]
MAALKGKPSMRGAVVMRKAASRKPVRSSMDRDCLMKTLMDSQEYQLSSSYCAAASLPQVSQASNSSSIRFGNLSSFTKFVTTLKTRANKCKKNPQSVTPRSPKAKKVTKKETATPAH